MITNNVGIGTTGATAYALDVSGTLHTNADAYINNEVRVGTGGGNSTQNVALGKSALLNNTTGQGIVAVGVSALQANTTGINNVAVGRLSLINNTTGIQNTAVGKSALFENTIGSDNSAFGYETLVSNTIGCKNTAIGSEAGRIMQDGSNNTFVGAYSDVNSNSSLYNNSTALGYNAIINDSNQVVLGGQPSGGSYPGVKIPGSYVGINGVYNTSSGYALDVSGNANVTGNLTNLMSLGFSSLQSNLSPNFIINAFHITHSGINVPGGGGNTNNNVYYNSTDGTSGTQKHIFTNAPYIFLNIVSTTGVNPQLINASANTIITSPNTFSVGVYNTSTSTTPLTAYTVQVLVIGY
jgi:hypothetical protein